MRMQCAVMPAAAAPVGALVLYPPKARTDQALYRVASHHPDGMAAQDKDNPRNWLIMNNRALVAVVQHARQHNTFHQTTTNTSNTSWTFT